VSSLIHAIEIRLNAADHRQLDPLQDFRIDLECIKFALLGLAVPKSLGLELIQRCVIRGIRYNDGFALGLRGLTPQFTRALNAQAILHNRIPNMQGPEDIPYCIWHPRSPTEDTCRALVQRYPHMAYQVGRVCAVAGYNELYRELNLLPETHIAEEARDNGAIAIYNAIIAHPVRYAVFNDYEMTYDPDTPRVATIDGDACVRSTLELKQRFSHPMIPKWKMTDFTRGLPKWVSNYSYPDGFEKQYFDITEDMCIDTYTSA
jgi:hypothetical protein